MRSLTHCVIVNGQLEYDRGTDRGLPDVPFRGSTQVEPLRDHKLIVPRDCVAALTEEKQGKALGLMRSNFGLDMSASGELDGYV